MNFNPPNPLVYSDSYKASHWKQYPPGTEYVYSYLESRGGTFPVTLFFGLQYILKEYFQGVFFDLYDLREAKRFYDKHMGEGIFNYKGWEHILNNHGGFLPLKIKAVPEGLIVPTRNVLLTVENADPHVPWLTNWAETLLVQSWYPITVASQSYAIRQLMDDYMARTVGHTEGIEYKLHDFGFRGTSSVESAALGGAAHLVNFSGTDTPVAIDMAQQYYDAGMIGNSIPAAEHSTITAWGPTAEYDAFKNMLTQYPNGPVAVVSDSFDIYKACKAWGTGALRDLVDQRDGVLVVRPDSGDPVRTVLKVLELLGENYIPQQNDMGFNTLPSNIRVIQGDGVDLGKINDILHRMEQEGWSTENITFGMGGALLQKLNRDTNQFAMKAAQVSGTFGTRDVWKSPVDAPDKNSKQGRLKLVKSIVDNRFETRPESDQRDDWLNTVFLNGELTQTETFDQIRTRARWS